MSSSRMPTMGHGPSRDEESRETYSQFTGKVFISTPEDTGPAYTVHTPKWLKRQGTPCPLGETDLTCDN